MAANKHIERFATLQLAMPSGINIASGQLILFGHGSHIMAGVAVEAQNTTNPPYDSNSGYLTIDFEGAYNLSVKAQVQGSPSVGAAVKPGDPIFADGGTFDATTGITYGVTLDADANGNYVGIALAAIAAGVTATIPVLLRNAS